MAQYEWEPAGAHNPWGKKRKRRTHCTKGHEFTPENTFVRSHDKARVCRECRKQYAREKYQRTKLTQPKKIKPKQIDLSDLYKMDENVRPFWYNLQEKLRGIQTPCQADNDVWMLYSSDNTHLINDEISERLCYGCPVIKECYQYADAADESWGIWGGVNFSKEELIDVDE